MVNSIQRDQRRRWLACKFETKRLQYKALLQDADLSLAIKQQNMQKNHKMVRNSSLTRVYNRCVLTGRARGVLRFCRLSRIKLRELASQGLVSGVCKTSW